MDWKKEHDVLPYCEILICQPFKFKERTVERGKTSEEISKYLNTCETAKFRVNKRSVRERFKLIKKKFKRTIPQEETLSGIEVEPSLQLRQGSGVGVRIFRREWNGVQKWNFMRSTYSYWRRYSDDPRPWKWHRRFVKWRGKRSGSAAIWYGRESEVNASLQFHETCFACAPREECWNVQRPGICRLDRPSRDQDLYSSWNRPPSLYFCS